MPRRRRRRIVQEGPMANTFRPEGGLVEDVQGVVLPVEGLEALRLSDLEKLDQQTAATCMDVSRQTFGRVLAEARQRVAEALVRGKTIRIQGGSYTLLDVPPGSHWRGRQHGRGRGRCRPFEAINSKEGR
jgi:predicted DNA-binding protein (UPF0251 family)